MEPLEDELSLALSSLPFLDRDVTLSDMGDTNVTALEVVEPEGCNAKGAPN